MPEINEIVDVAISIQSSGIAQASFDSILINGRGGTTNDQNFNAGWANHEVRQYTSYAALAADSDIKPASNVIEMAEKIFAQTPAVGNVYVARSDDGTPLPQISQLTYNTVPLVSGQDVEVFIGGVSIGSVSWTTDNDTTMDTVAALIQTESEVATAVASAVDSVDKNTITITGAVDGVSFTVSSEVQTGATVDESIVASVTQAAENLLSSSDITSILANDDSWFAYVHDFTANADHEIAAAACAAAKKFSGFSFFAATPNLGTNLAFSIYSDDRADCSWMSAMLGRTVGSYNPAYMTLELTDANTVSTAKETELRDGYANQYSSVAGVDVTYNGRAANGGWIDTYIGALWLEKRIQEAIFASLVANEKLPYDNAGIAAVGSTLYSVLQQAEDQGVISSSPKFTVNVPLASSVSPTDRSDRILNNVSFTAYSGAGINRVQINGTIID